MNLYNLALQEIFKNHVRSLPKFNRPFDESVYTIDLGRQTGKTKAIIEFAGNLKRSGLTVVVVTDCAQSVRNFKRFDILATSKSSVDNFVRGIKVDVLIFDDSQCKHINYPALITLWPNICIIKVGKAIVDATEPVAKPTPEKINPNGIYHQIDFDDAISLLLKTRKYNENR